MTNSQEFATSKLQQGCGHLACRHAVLSSRCLGCYSKGSGENTVNPKSWKNTPRGSYCEPPTKQRKRRRGPRVWNVSSANFALLDFIHSGRIAKRFGQVLYELPRDFYRIGVCGRLAKSRVRPQLLSNQRQSIRESRAGFAVPRSLPDSPHASRHSLVGEQRNDREQPQQRRCGPPDC